MNVLQLCNKSPFPPKEGGPIAMYNLGYGLMNQGHNVDILTMNTFKFRWMWIHCLWIIVIKQVLRLFLLIQELSTEKLL